MQSDPPIDYDSLWANRSFVLLFSAQVISLLGSGATTVALALLAYEMGGSEAAAVLGNALMLRIVAFLIFSQPAGVLADRWPRKRILVLADLARAALLLLVPWATETSHVYVLVFALNALTAFFTPAYESSLPSVVTESQLVRALSVSRVAIDVEAIAAPTVAAVIVALAGPRWIFPLDALTYLLSALLIAAVALPVVTPASETTRAVSSDLTHGLRVLFREPSLRYAVTLAFVEALAGACAIVGTVSYVRDVLELSETAVPWVMGAVGLGSSIAALFVSRWVARRERAAEGAALGATRQAWTHKMLGVGAAALCAATLPGALVPALAPFVALWLLNGAGQALVAIPSAILLAERTAPSERGRVYAAHFASTHAWWLIAYPVVGHAIVRWGSSATFTAMGALATLVTFAARRSLGTRAPPSTAT